VVQVLSALGPGMLILVKNDQANLRKVREAAAAASSSSGTRVAQSVRALCEDELRRGIHTPGDVVSPPASASPAPPPSRGRMAAFPPSTISRSLAGCTGGASLHDPSAAMALLWLKRTLAFTLIIMENLLHAKRIHDDELLVQAAEELDLDHEEAEPPSLADAVVDAIRDGYAKTVRPFHSWLLRKTFDLVSTQMPSLDEAMVMMGPGLGEADRVETFFADVRMYVNEGRPVAAALDALFAELKLEDLRQV